MQARSFHPGQLPEKDVPHISEMQHYVKRIDS